MLLGTYVILQKYCSKKYMVIILLLQTTVIVCVLGALNFAYVFVFTVSQFPLNLISTIK